jgi:hypothetical protein
MEPSISVLYKGFLAHFTITKIKDGVFTAHLLKYQGHIVNEPPQEFTLQKEGRHWCNANTNQDLLDDVGFAIEDRQNKLKVDTGK